MQRLLLVVTRASLFAVVALGGTVGCAGGGDGPGAGPGEGEGELDSDDCEVDGAVLPLPKDEAGDVVQPVLPAGGEIDLSCIGTPAALDQSAAVRLQGCIDVFGLGDRAKRGIKVAVFDGDQNPGTDVPAHGEVDIAVQEDATGLDCAGADASQAACLALQCDRKGAYSIADIPVHVPLIMKVYAPGDTTVIDTYSYGVVLDHLDNAAVEGVVSYDASLIYSSTWDSIPTLAGRLIDGGLTLGDGVGRAVIAGEIHDCQDRLVQGASVTSDQLDATTKVTYFDGNEADPKPKLARLSTNTDGLYVVLNASTDAAAGSDTHTITAGVAEPGCAGEDCQCLSLGSRTVRAFPDSVTVVTLRGDLPTLN